MRTKSALSFIDRIQISVDTRLKIYDMLDSYISAGIGLKVALTKMQETEKLRKGNRAVLYRVYGLMLRRLGSGKKLGDLFEGISPESERMVLNAGGTNIKESFKAAIDVAVITRKMNKGFYGAQVYPMLLYIVAYTFLIIYSIYFLPSLLQVLPAGAELSLLTKIGIFLNKYTKYWVPITMVLNIGIFAFIAISMPNWKGPLRRKVENIPPYNMYRLKVGCSWLIAAASLIRAGVKLDQAMSQLMKFAKPYLRHRISSTVFHLKRGSNLGIALTKTKLDFPDPDMVDRIGVYAQGKDFADRMDVLAKEFAERGIEKINTQASVIRTLGLLVVAIVGMMIAGINFTITHDLTESAQNSISTR